MALNPQLFATGIPVPFVNESFLLARPDVEFQVDKIPQAPGGKFSTKGTIYLSNVRVVFVTKKPMGDVIAFDMPLIYIHDESFNQPIFGCNNISGKVDPVIPEGEHTALYAPHTFKILFKEGGCGTFVPLFLNLLKVVRQYHQQAAPDRGAPSTDPLATAPPPPDEIVRHAYIDPNDPTKVYVQQPYESEPQLRRRNYSSNSEGQI